jgi:hypothetical protein
MPQRMRLDRTAGLEDELLAEILSHFDFYHRCAALSPLNYVAGSSCVWHLCLCGWSISSPSDVPPDRGEPILSSFQSEFLHTCFRTLHGCCNWRNCPPFPGWMVLSELDCFEIVFGWSISDDLGQGNFHAVSLSRLNNGFG